MIILKLGSQGLEVKLLQLNLKALGFYKAAIDGQYGPQTQVSVKEFQKKFGLSIDGVAGRAVSTKIQELLETKDEVSLIERCLMLTGTIETSKTAPDCFAKVSGNFDGQALSFGALQWNFGQKSLQPLLINLFTQFPSLMESIFGADAALLKDLVGPLKQQTLMKFFIDMQATQDKSIWKIWTRRFEQLGKTQECINEELRAARSIFQRALAYCEEYGLQSERAVALMFDICVQNGSIKSDVRAIIMKDFEKVKSEEEKLYWVAYRRSKAALPRWQDDVLNRKMTVATGKGKVHGITFDLETQYGITMKSAAELKQFARVA